MKDRTNSIDKRYGLGLRYTNQTEERNLDNLNNAVNDTAELLIPGFEGLNYFIQSFTMPAVNIPRVETPYLGNMLSTVGDAINYGELTLDFFVDEDLSNYVALIEWVQLQAHENDHLKKKTDISIHWKSRNLRSIREIKFVGAFVTDVGSFTMVTNGTDQDVLLCSLTFSYQYFDINNMDGFKAAEV